MSAERLPKVAAACFLIGLGLVFLINLGVARIIGVPLIFFWIWRLRKRFANGERLRSFADVRIK